MRNTSIAKALLVLSLLWAGGASAQAVPPLLPVQGYLSDSGGNALDGTYTIVFRLYDAASAGTQRFTETVDVDVEGGFFTVYLGDQTVGGVPASLFNTYPNLFLALKVGADPESAPRIQIATAGFAAKAQFCGEAGTIGGVALANLRQLGDNVAWSDLSGIPAGFADGTDNVLSQATVEGYAAGVCYNTEAELTAVLNDNYYDSEADLTALLNDNYSSIAHTHTYGSLTGIPASFVPSAHTHSATDINTGTLADARYSAYADLTAEGYLDNNAVGDLVTSGTLSAVGTLNAGTNPVDWTKLKGVPAGFADGVDADSGGDIAGITTASNSGLSGGCTSGTCTLSVSPTALHGTGPAVTSYVNSLTNIDNSGYATLHNLAITVPRSGLVVAMYDGNWNANNLGAANTLSCINFGFTTTSTGTPSDSRTACATYDGSNGSAYQRVPSTTVIPVTAGTTTVYVRGRQNISGDTGSVYSHNLSLMFIPL
jgi:hypothetical protein